MANPTSAQRKVYAMTGVAMKDGSYYVRPDHPEDLTNAVEAVGRAKGTNGQSDDAARNAARVHVIKRAKVLKRSSEIPDTWNSDGTLKHEDLDAFIAHFGRKGMKWGERIFSRGEHSSPARPSAPKTSSDAARAHAAFDKAKTSGIHALSNEDLQGLVTRMNLEQQYSRLTAEPETKSKVKKGRDFVADQTKTAQTVVSAVKTGKEVAKLIGPLIVIAGAAAAARKGSGGSSGPIRMPQLAIGA